MRDDAGQHGVGALHGGQQVGAEVRRADDAGAHAVRRQLVAGRLGECDDGGLDGVVRRHAGGVHQPGERGHVDDVPGALLLEHRHEGARAAHDTEQVDLGDPAPLLEGGHVQASTAGHAGVVDQQVEASPLGEHLLPGERPVVVAGHVQREVHVVGRKVGGQHLVATRSQGAGQRGPETRGGPGDEDLSGFMCTCPARGGRPSRGAPRPARRRAAGYARSRTPSPAGSRRTSRRRRAPGWRSR